MSIIPKPDEAIYQHRFPSPGNQKKEKTKWPKMPEANLPGFRSLTE
jgi:hypothetical protein